MLLLLLLFPPELETKVLLDYFRVELFQALIPSPNCQVNTVVVAKLSSGLEVEWSQQYGQAEGESQMFDLLVDRCLVTRAS